MNIKQSVFIFFICISIVACKNKIDQTSTEDNTEMKENKHISELTFQEILFLLHNENEFGSDYHGESFGQDAKNHISLIISDEADCGEKITLVNTSKDSRVAVAIMITFNFPNNPVNEIAMVHRLNPSEIKPIGNSKLCYNGEQFEISRKILTAGFID